MRPCGAFGKFGSFINDDVDGFICTNSIPNGSRCTSFEAVFLVPKGGISGGLRYSFGIGFVDFVVPSLSADWMDPIPILYQSALLKLVLLGGAS